MSRSAPSSPLYAPKAKHHLGQHFLLDPGICQQIASVGLANVGAGTETLVEIGPGPGGLTRALLDHLSSAQDKRHLIAIEKDDRFIPALEVLAREQPGRLKIIAGDARTYKLSDLAQKDDQKFRIIANLPYNVGTFLLTSWLKQASRISEMTLMFQREVAARITAAPASAAYGRLSVLCQWCAQVEPLFDIPAEAFTPPPKVTSTLVRLVPYEEPPQTPPFQTCRFSDLETVTAAAFTQRRKMLKSALKPLAKRHGFNLNHLLKQADIEPELRAEMLTPADFSRLAANYALLTCPSARPQEGDPHAV